MIDLNLSDLLGGEPMSDEEMKTMPVFHVFSSAMKSQVLERIVADDIAAAEAKAHELLTDIRDMYVTGPHEHVNVPVDAVSDEDEAHEPVAIDKSDFVKDVESKLDVDAPAKK